ncbi:MAG TPA: hypothetical protein VLR71_04670 [Casimicrobiaceae bacterium]|nr:hypothetical protein [Casimicrobiaceae bacterium]
MNGLSLLALIAVAVAIVAAYRIGRSHGRRDGPLSTLLGAGADVRTPDMAPTGAAAVLPSLVASAPPAAAAAALPSSQVAAHGDAIGAEKARLMVAYEAEAARLRADVTAGLARELQLRAFADDRRRLFRDLASARGDLARYRQIVVDIENDAPPPILGERGAPDDLKLIVGVGPVLERMLQQLGIATYRQIARWTEHDIDDMDARLPEFPGRIRRDAWVTQARALHQSKYGERP